MKKTTLKSLVEFIVRRTFAEMDAPTKAEVEVEGENYVLVTNAETDDGRLVSGRFRIKGSVEKSGIGSYEFWGHRGYDRGTNQWVLQDYTLIQAWDENNNQINLKDPANKPVIDALTSELESHQDYIEQSINDNL